MGLTFTNPLGNAYVDDYENNNGQITIRFIDVPIDSQLDHDQQISQEDAKSTEIDSLTNNNNDDPDNITTRITGMSDDENGNTIDNSKMWDDNNPIKDHDYGFAATAEDIEQTGVDPQDDNIRPTEVTTDHGNRPTRVEDQITPLQTTTELEINVDPNETEEQYEYINLQGVFGDLLLDETIENIPRITSDNKQQNYRKALDFIANNARRDQMINNYITRQHRLQA